jgi:hypothetical protein
LFTGTFASVVLEYQFAIGFEKDELKLSGEFGTIYIKVLLEMLRQG